MPTATGIIIRTWGTTDSQEETGIGRFAKDYLYQAVVGHASIELILPATKANWLMVEKYLKNTSIPYNKERLETKKVFYVQGQPVFSEENAFEEDVIKVYFSWWPNNGDDNQHFTFNTLEKDLTSERLSTEVGYTPEWEAYLQPEKRHKEWLLSKVITLPPNQVLHERGATPAESKLLTAYHQCNKLIQDIGAFNLLVSKMRSKIGPYISINDFSDTEKFLLRKFLPEFFSEENEYRPANILAQKMNAHTQFLLQKYNQLSKQLSHLVTQFHLEAKEKLAPLLQNTPLSPSAFKRIQTILNDHDIFIENEAEIRDVITQLFEAEEKANQKLLELAPLIAQTKEQLTKIGTETSRLKRVSKSCHAYRELVSFAPYQNINVAILNQGKQKLMEALSPFFEHEISDANLIDAIISIEQSLLDLRKLKYEAKELLKHLTSSEHEAVKHSLAFGYGKLKKLIKRHITSGQLPDHTVNLGLKGLDKPGLDPEKMLHQMAAFVLREESFKLLTFNCSHTVSDILAAGAGYQGWVFKQRAFSGSIVTPQILYNNALAYSRGFSPGTNLTAIENEDSWQNYFANWAVSSAEESLNPNEKTLTRIWSAFNALGAAATTVTIENAKALFEGTHKQEKKTKNKP